MAVPRHGRDLSLFCFSMTVNLLMLAFFSDLKTLVERCPNLQVLDVRWGPITPEKLKAFVMLFGVWSVCGTQVVTCVNWFPPCVLQWQCSLDDGLFHRSSGTEGTRKPGLESLLPHPPCFPGVSLTHTTSKTDQFTISKFCAHPSFYHIKI